MVPTEVAPGAAVLSSTLFPTTEICARARTGAVALRRANAIGSELRKFEWRADITFFRSGPLGIVHQRQRYRACRHRDDSGGDCCGELVFDNSGLRQGVRDV